MNDHDNKAYLRLLELDYSRFFVSLLTSYQIMLMSSIFIHVTLRSHKSRVKLRDS